ncbi:MAG: preprotein translocase subunit YajC [Burkholderiaceae bacterium]|nr:preprotein translocase subunit YajC [Burkholderiaceae bacterium]
MPGYPAETSSVLISTAYAQALDGASGQQIVGFLPIILMFVVLYFLMIRPQTKRAKEHRTMLAALKKGDEVVTNGGLLGRVTKVGESYVTIEVARTAEGKGGDTPIEMAFQKASVQTLLPNGTLKSI